jgi:hypothetical protein
VRFKTASGAKCAALYLKHEYIVQKHAHDSGTMYHKDPSSEVDLPRIRISILAGILLFCHLICILCVDDGYLHIQVETNRIIGITLDRCSISANRKSLAHPWT